MARILDQDEEKFVQGIPLSDYLERHTITDAQVLPMNNILNQIQNRQGTNMAATPGLYMPEDVKYREYPQNLNASGFVAKDLPNNVYISKFRDETTIPHELAHVQQNRSNVDFPTISKMPMPLLGSLMKMRGDFEHYTNKQQDDSGLHYGAFGNLRELLAGLQGREANMPEGKTVWDHPEISKRFPDEYQRRYLDQKMFPLQNKMYPGPEVAPSTKNSPDFISKLQSMIRQWTAK